MTGAMPLSILAAIAVPSAWQCLVVTGPFLAVAAVWWLINRTDQILNHLFPNWEWERQLGWLNIRAERRARTALRWLGYCVYLVLAGALYGIVWGVQGLPAADQWSEPAGLGEVAVHLPVLLICAGIWLVYLGCALIPKLHHQQEEEDLEKFRAEVEEYEKDRKTRAPSRLRGKGFDPHTPTDRMGPRR